MGKLDKYLDRYFARKLCKETCYDIYCKTLGDIDTKWERIKYKHGSHQYEYRISIKMHKYNDEQWTQIFAFHEDQATKKYFAPDFSKHIKGVVDYYLSDKYIGDKEVG